MELVLKKMQAKKKLSIKKRVL